ncbi:hypothetical protein ACIBBE_42770 [Streptomyces sp. NPDC051644]|uniref:hypothetical protein n=1 Tax=Streptomyces sp. NPDC051644 TaxID=3365666 RepID=UPI0037A2E552
MPWFLFGQPLTGGLTHLTATLSTAAAGLIVGVGNFGALGLCAGAATTYVVWSAPRLLITWARRRRLRILTDAQDVAALTPVVALHRTVHTAAHEHPSPELEHAARLGHHMLWDLVGLLRNSPRDPTVAEQIAAYREAYADTAHHALGVRTSAADLAQVVEQTAPTEPFPALCTSTQSEDRMLTLQALAEASDALAQLAAAQRYAAQHLDGAHQPMPDN